MGTSAVGVNACNVESPSGLLVLAKGGRKVGDSFEDETIVTLLVKAMVPLIIAVLTCP